MLSTVLCATYEYTPFFDGSALPPKALCGWCRAGWAAGIQGIKMLLHFPDHNSKILHPAHY